MFARRKRLSREVLSSLLSSGRRVSSTHFSAVIPRNVKDLSAAKQGYAVIVSKKTARLAVTRHQIKRRVQGALRALSTPLPPSLVLYPRPSILNIGYDALKKELTTLISSL